MPKINTAISRARKKGDDSYNARRRYIRSSERYLKKAEQSSGASAGRYRQLAKQEFNKAVGTYKQGQRQKPSEALENLSKRLNVPIERDITLNQKDTWIKTQERLIKESTDTLISNVESINLRAEREAESIIKSPEISRRIIGGLVDVWKKPLTLISGKVNVSQIFEKIFDFFKVDTFRDLLTKIENILGDLLYSGDEYEGYNIVSLTLQTKYVTGELVQ